MDPNPGTIAALVVVWGALGVAGVMFIRQAVQEKRKMSSSRLRRAVNEVRFRLRLAAGIALLLWVFSGLIWVITHWL